MNLYKHHEKCTIFSIFKKPERIKKKNQGNEIERTQQNRKKKRIFARKIKKKKVGRSWYKYLKLYVMPDRIKFR
jgi:hypothetical protein